MKNDKKNPSKMHQTIRYSIIEGIFSQGYQVIIGIGSYFIVQLLLLLNASSFHFGLMAGIAPLSQAMQIFAAHSLKFFKDKKKPTVIYLFISKIIIILVVVVVVILPKTPALYLALTVLLISNLLFMASQNAWNTWIAESIPHHFRGRFFAERNRWITLIGLLFGFIVSIYIDLFKEDSFFSGTLSNLIDNFSQLSFLTAYINSDNLFNALMTAFILAVIVGCIGIWFLGKQPAFTKDKPSINRISDSFFNSIKKPFLDKNFSKLLIFFAYWNFSVNLPRPLWGKFMQEILKMDFFEYWLYGAISSIVLFLIYKWWGKRIDKYGNKPVMAICIFLGGINPLFFVFAQADWFWILYIEAIGSAIMWSAGILVTSNFVLTLAPKEGKEMYIAVLAMVSGITGFSSSVLSGIICDLIPTWKLSWITFTGMQAVFFIGSILRWLSILFLIPIYEANSMPLSKLLATIYLKIKNLIFIN